MKQKLMMNRYCSNTKTGVLWGLPAVVLCFCVQSSRVHGGQTEKNYTLKGRK